MSCRLCEESEGLGANGLCEKCEVELEHGIGMKCLFCGAYGFIPKTTENIHKVNIIMGQDIPAEEYIQGIVIVPAYHCPECEVYQGAIREDLIH